MMTLPFTQLTVDGYRGLKNLEITDLRTINLLVGGNNSGKTSILEACALLANPVPGSEWLQVVRRRDYGRLDESLVMSLRWCFAQGSGIPREDAEQLEYRCEFSLDGAYPLKRMVSVYREFFAELDLNDRDVARAIRYQNVRNEVLSEVPVRTCTIESTLEWGAGEFDLLGERPDLLGPPSSSRVLKINDQLSYMNTPIGRRNVSHKGKQGLSYAALLPYSYQLNTLQVSARSDQLFLDDNQLLIDLIRQFDENVLNVEVASFTGQRPAIYIKHKILGVAPLSVFGDAMRRCLLLATTMTSLGRGGVLLLDEVEVGIHTDSLSKVFQWLSSAALQLGVQVIATTHSLEVLDALLASSLGDEHLAAYRIKQAGEFTECRRFSGESLQRLRFERGLDIR